MLTNSISRRKLALWLALPAIRGEFGPTHPFENEPDMVLEQPWPAPDRSLRDLRAEFVAAIERVVGDSADIAVSTSGGLDSLAVLVNAVRAFGDERKVRAVAIEMIDDRGRSNVPVIERVLRGLDLRCELRTAPLSQRPAGRPQWHPEGPRLDALPDANRVVAELAHAAGAEVILSGDGSDELLGSTQFLTLELLRAGRWRDLPGYWRDHPGEHYSTAKLEAVALRAAFERKRKRAMLYLASSWPELCRNPSHDFLREPYRGLADEWAGSWIGSLVAMHEHHHATFATMDAWSSLYPHQRLRTPGLVRAEDPFLEPGFVADARRLPLHMRYDPGYPCAYWRRKSQVVKLLPAEAVPYLPTEKQIFSRAILDRVDTEVLAADTLVDSGILDAGALRKEIDPMVATRIMEVELWLAEAIDLGYEIVD